MRVTPSELTYAQGCDVYEQRNYLKAESIFTCLLIHNPNRGSFWAALGASLLMQHKYERAASAYQFAIKLSPSKPEYYLYGAECLWHQQKREEALNMLDKTPREPAFIEQIDLYKKQWSEATCK